VPFAGTDHGVWVMRRVEPARGRQPGAGVLSTKELAARDRELVDRAREASEA